MPIGTLLALSLLHKETPTVNQKQPSQDTNDAVTNTPPLDSRRHQEALLDQAVADSFPASDPIAPAVQARLEPADVSLDDQFTDNGTRFRSRVLQAAPSLIAIGTAAVALMALRAIRNSRAAKRE
jgi:hypothetical protein